MDSYSGPFPFSEPESRNICDYVLTLRPTPILALSFHSYGQTWLYPYFNTENNYPKNVDEIVS